MSTLFALLLPLSSWLGFFLLCRELSARHRIHHDWRLSWVLASVAWGLLLTLFVETSGAIQQFTREVLAAAWVVSGATAIALASLLAARRGITARSRIRQSATRLRDGWQQTPLDGRLGLIGAAGLLAVAALLAVFTSCTNFDSMTYHLSRIAHWATQRSVAFYPTNDWRQLELGPWAEFAAANFYVLEANDRLVNLVQWFSMLTSVVGACLLARQLLPGWMAGGGMTADDPSASAARVRRRAGALTAVLVASIPIGLAQSMTTQNDFVLACWLVCAVALSAALAVDASNAWYAAGLSGALALGFFTKSTMALFVAPFAAAITLFVLVRLRAHRLRLRFVALLTAGFLAVNGPHMARNDALYGSPMGSNDAVSLLRTSNVTLSGTASNVIRNLSLHTATGSAIVTHALDKALLFAHGFTGRALNDPDLTFPFMPFSIYDSLVVSDSSDNSAYHLLLVGFALGLVAFGRLPRRRTLTLYAGLVVASFVVFCALLRWQPWHSRFHLALLVLFMPLCGAVLAGGLPSWATGAVATGFSGLGLVALSVNVSRPLTAEFLRSSREQQYFLQGVAAYPGYRAVADDVVASGCRVLGLYRGFDDWEYPVWAFLRNRGFDGDLRNVGVEGPSATLQKPALPACAMISTVPRPPAELVARFPVHARRPVIDLWWTEPASRWAVLTRETQEGVRPVAAREPEVPFENGVITLDLRTGRPGVLDLVAQVAMRPGNTRGVPSAVADDALDVTTRRGLLTSAPIAGGAVHASIHWPSDGVISTLSLALASREAGNLFLYDLNWTWTPDPLP